MCPKDLLYNVNRIIVKPCLISDYIRFSKKLNTDLLARYPKYYLGLQLYQDKNIPNIFHVVATYADIAGIYKIIPCISDHISNVYDFTWGDSVERTSLFSFAGSNKIFA